MISHSPYMNQSDKVCSLPHPLSLCVVPLRESPVGAVKDLCPNPTDKEHLWREGGELWQLKSPSERNFSKDSSWLTATSYSLQIWYSILVKATVSLETSWLSMKKYGPWIFLQGWEPSMGTLGV